MVKPGDTIFLDWYGTLSITHFWHTWKPHRTELVEDLKSTFAADTEKLIVPWMRGQISSEEYVDKLARNLHLKSQHLLQALQHSSQRFEFINPKLPHVIQNLREKGYKVVLATDNMDAFTRWTVPALGLTKLFDDLLVSSDLGALKSDHSYGRSNFFSTYLEMNSGTNVFFDDTADAALMQSFGINLVNIKHGQDIVPLLDQLI